MKQSVKGCVLEDKELRLHVKIFFPKFYYPRGWKFDCAFDLYWMHSLIRKGLEFTNFSHSNL